MVWWMGKPGETSCLAASRRPLSDRDVQQRGVGWICRAAAEVREEFDNSSSSFTEALDKAAEGMGSRQHPAEISMW